MHNRLGIGLGGHEVDSLSGQVVHLLGSMWHGKDLLM